MPPRFGSGRDDGVLECALCGAQPVVIIEVRCRFRDRIEAVAAGGSHARLRLELNAIADNLTDRSYRWHGFDVRMKTRYRF